MVANDISRKDIGFSSDMNEVYILDKNLKISHIERDTKLNIAKQIFKTQKNWNRAIIVHAYDQATYPITVFMANNIALMAKNNPTSPYKYLRLNDYDCIAGRCTKDFKGIHGQCEFFRATKAHGGIISIHYINKDKDDFIKNYQLWYDIIRKAKFMNTYWRNDRILNKSEFFELW